jgi:hypothetical protein
LKLQQQVLFLCSEHQMCFTLIPLITSNDGSPELGPKATAAANAYRMASSDSKVVLSFSSFQPESMESLAAAQRQLTLTGGGTKARRSQRALTGGALYFTILDMLSSKVLQRYDG